MATLTWVDGHGLTNVPDQKITTHQAHYVYRPCRAFSASVAVESFANQVIGWMSVEDLPGGPYLDVTEWMRKTHYTPRNSCTGDT